MAKAARKAVAVPSARRETPAPRRETVESNFPDLDRLIHEKTRLAIVSALAVNPSVTFNEMKAILKTTDGNVSVHTRKLEEAGYLHQPHTSAGRIPTDRALFSPEGRPVQQTVDITFT